MQHAKIMNVLRQTNYISNMNPDSLFFYFLFIPNFNLKNNRCVIGD